MVNWPGLVVLAIAVFWMVVGWRAMKALEKLADSVERLTQGQAANPETQSEASQED